MPPDALKVGVLGAGGRMGAETCRAIEADDDLELCARIGRGDDLQEIVSSGAQVVVDFTVADGAEDRIRFCVEHSIPVVVGVTGIAEDALTELGSVAESHGVGVFVAPNFAVGAVLMMRFAAQAARFFDRAEIVERHHDKKLDAPSGTSLHTASVMNEARTEPWPENKGSSEARGRNVDGVTIHSVRMPGYVAHQEVVLGGPGETLTIKHDSIDRSSFMPGVVLAVKKAGELRGLVVGLERLLDL